ncbi:AMP-binding protein [bacterium]|nr:AMP-binding protein [bacterium]
MLHQNLNLWLETVVSRRAESMALTFLRSGSTESQLSYRESWDDVNRIANTLIDLDVKKGDRVVLFLPKSLFNVLAHFGILAAGAISVPLNPGFKQDEMRYLVSDAEPTLIIVAPETRAVIEASAPGSRLLEVDISQPYQQIDFFRTASADHPTRNVRPEDPGLIIYTSGTTGKPKGAVLTQRNMVADCANVIDIWEISADDVLCHALPLFHVHGLCFALHTALLSGAQVRLLDRFQPEVVVSELSRTSGAAVCSIFMAVPAMYKKITDYIANQRFDFSHLRLLTSGSAPLLVSEFRRIAEVFGCEPVEREGMTETGMNFSNPLHGRRVAGSIGHPLPGLRVRVVDPATGADLVAGEVGELWLKSDSISTSYWRKPRETADTFSDGWFRTGDLGRVDGEGYYYLTDRIKHIIISGGENVSGKEVEGVINEIDGVSESVAVGTPDEQLGERVVAAVVCRPGVRLTEEDIKRHCKAKLHDWKCPKEILFLEHIPRNTMGKVLKEAVRDIFIDNARC